MPAIIGIHENGDRQANLIGSSINAEAALEDPGLSRFFEERGYAWGYRRMRPEPAADGGLEYNWSDSNQGPGFRYIEVRPPLTPEDTRDLGAICINVVGSAHDHSGTVVLDNREQPIEGPYGDEIIARG